MIDFIDSTEASLRVMHRAHGFVRWPSDPHQIYWDVAYLFCDAKLARSSACDYMSRDFLDASDFSYPENGPNIHHWNSIEHFKVDGSVIGVPASTLEDATGIHSRSKNVLTDARRPMYRLVRDRDADFCDRMVCPTVDKRRIYTFFCLSYHPISQRFFAYAELMTTVYDRGDYSYSFSLYDDVPKRRITSLVIHIVEYDASLTRRRYYDGSIPTDIQISASPIVGDVLAKLLGGILRKSISNLLRKVALSSWVNAGPKIVLTGIQKPDLHSPSPAIFQTQKRRYFNWPALAGQAYQSLGMADVNGIAYLKDMFEFGSACTSFAATLKSIPHKKVKAVAAAWLSVHYGFRLFLADTKEILEVLEKETARRSSLSRCEARTFEEDGAITFAYGYQVFYDQWAKVRSMLEQTVTLLDLGLNLDNIWDMVPYSFVIDWFVDIGSVLKSLQNFSQLQQEHSLICCGRSIKGVTSLRPSQLGLQDDDATCSGVVSYYTRQYRDRLVIPSLVPSVTFNPFDHLVEAAALTIVRVAP